MDTMQLVTMLLPLATAGILWGVKYLAPKIPRGWIPWLAPIIGTGLTLLGNFSTGAETNPFVGTALGLASVGLREMLDQWRQGNVNPATATKVDGTPPPLVAPSA